ncbi:MAG: cytochrome c1 [Halocynthiibacter sp.]
MIIPTRLAPGRPAMAIRSAFVVLGFAVVLSMTSMARAEEPGEVETQKWSFGGFFGNFDRAQLQRGFQIVKENCANCHSFKYVYFRNLGEPGGPEFTEAEVKALAAEVSMIDGPDDAGDMFERPGLPSDLMPPPFANDNAARASNGGALPPDLSVIAKARSFKRGFPNWFFDLFTGYQEVGTDYIYGFLTGYEDAPEDVTILDGLNYNKVFPGHQTAMPQPLFEDGVEYNDGTAASVDQMAKDVTSFLMWAAEPHLEARKRIGFQVLIFLFIFVGLFYATKRKIWSRVKH